MNNMTFPFGYRQGYRQGISLPPVIPAFPLFQSCKITINRYCPVNSNPVLLQKYKRKHRSLFMQVLKEDIRGRILAVAEQRFGQQGYSKTSMREIAGAVGVGVGNIYNYFRNKDELFCEVVRPVLHAMEAMLQEHHGIRGEDVMTMRSKNTRKPVSTNTFRSSKRIAACWRSCCSVPKALRWNIFAKATPTVRPGWSRHGSPP